MQEYIKLKKNGITLIALVITVIILLIIAAVSIGLVTNGGLFDITDEATFKTRMQQFKEKTDMYMLNLVSNSIIENAEILAKSKINAGKVLEEMIGQEESPLREGFSENDISNELKEIIPQVNSKEENYLVIYEGEFCYVSKNSTPHNTDYKKWCKQIGIKILEFNGGGIDDILPEETFEIVDGTYLNVNGLYVCTPNLTGFVKNKTRYLKVNDKGYLVTTNEFSTLAPGESWYDYSNREWANIYVESEGNCLFYTWIPRYAYKVADNNVAGEERTEVIFIDLDNSYKYIDKDGNEQIKTWDELKNEYIVPNAFYFGDNDNDTDTPIPGYWMSKYPLGEFTSDFVIQYDFAADGDAVLIRNIQINISGVKNFDGQDVEAGYYQYAMNGKVIATIKASENPAEYRIPGLKKGMNTFTVTLLDVNEEIIGSMTKEYEISEANAPDLTGFNLKNTYYVTYDENEEEHSTIPLTEPTPKNWYAYEYRKWANIVVRQNGAETYYTWIPRYAYTTSGQRATVKFLKDTSSEIPENYIIPDAFAWGDNDSDATKNSPISGYWVSKYPLGSSNTIDLNAECINTSNTITLYNLTGAGITENQTYIYWIDGVRKHTTTNASEGFTYTGLTAGRLYTVLIEIRNNDANSSYVGTITKEVKTNTANEPNLMGFDNDTTDEDNTMTYYVTYEQDENGEWQESTNYIPITQPAPQNWYNYSEKRWANIVVIKTDDSGNDVSKTFFTWIPRYAYRVVTDRQKLDVIFLPGTSTDVPKSFTIPDAFAWGDNDSDATKNSPITGYWISKYPVG